MPILERGPEWFAAAGTERSKGYKIVSISGHVQKPGNYEVALGTTSLADDLPVAKRSSVSHSGRPTARAKAGQWRSPSSPTIQKARPSPAV